MNILFICKYNRFRSKVAEAIFNHLNKNKKIEAKSAGIQLDLMRPYVAESVLEILNEKGIKIKDEKSHEINDGLIKWADRIIIVADNVPVELFPEEKTEKWDIKDADESETEKINKTIIDIETRLKILIGRAKLIKR